MYYNLPMEIDIHSFPNHNERLSEVKKYIHDHIHEPLNREVLAAVAGFSVPHFHRIFTEHMEENISHYIRRARLERAGRKLRLGAVDITEVALAAGYDTHSAFGKAFKQQYGLSPSEFRSLNCWDATEILRKG